MRCVRTALCLAVLCLACGRGSELSRVRPSAQTRTATTQEIPAGVWHFEAGGAPLAVDLDRLEGVAWWPRTGRLQFSLPDGGPSFSLEVEADVAKGHSGPDRVLGYSERLLQAAPRSYDLAPARVRIGTDGGTVKAYAPEGPPMEWDGKEPHSPRSQVLTGEADPQLTRRRLKRVMMNGGADLLQLDVQAERGVDAPALASASREDAPDPSPGLYQLIELHFVQSLLLPDRTIVKRDMHGYLAVPTGDQPPAGWPAIVALNGHGASASTLFDPNETLYFYGDAFARKGYVVLGIDVGHRPLQDRADLYTDVTFDAVHLAIAAPGAESEWEEDGERAWDAITAAQWLREQTYVDPKREGVVGLSLGGEVAAWAAALDPDLRFAVVAGFSPDLDVLSRRNNHPCWKWRHTELRDWVDMGDVLSLIAPRPLTVQTGLRDVTFSDFEPPYASDVQVLARARPAWPDASRLVHTLHDGAHQLRATPELFEWIAQALTVDE